MRVRAHSLPGALSIPAGQYVPLKHTPELLNEELQPPPVNMATVVVSLLPQ